MICNIYCEVYNIYCVICNIYYGVCNIYCGIYNIYILFVKYMVSETQNINLRLVLIVCSASVYERALKAPLHGRIINKNKIILPLSFCHIH